MRILVTGGAGYVGSAVVRYLTEADHSVVVLDDLRDGCAACVPADVEFAVGGVADKAVLQRLIPGVDAVVHCAGARPADGGLGDPGVVLEDNAAGPLSLLSAMAAAGVDRLVWTSCAAVYGEPDVVPIVEGAMTSPLAPFGESKMMFERMTDWFGDPFGLRTVTLRLFDVAGAWPDGTIGEAHDFQGHLIPRVLTALAAGEESIDVLGGYPTPDGTPIRDYVHVHDVGRAVALALDWLGGGASGGTFNISSARGHSAMEVVQACREVTGSDIEAVAGGREPWEPAVLVGSYDSAEATFGWRPDRGTLHTILTDAWHWHAAHPRGYEPV
jgi:UDP-glucose 4-epimerase